jgi:hypothetical protein
MTKKVVVTIEAPEEDARTIDGKLALLICTTPNEDKTGTHVAGCLVHTGEYTDEDKEEISYALDAIMTQTLVEAMSFHPEVTTVMDIIHHMSALTEAVIEKLVEDEGGVQ